MKKTRKVIFFTLIVVFLGVFVEFCAFVTLKLLPNTFSGERLWMKQYEDSGLYDGIDLQTFHDEATMVWENVSYDFYRGYRPGSNVTGRYISTDKDGFRKTEQYMKDDPHLPTKVIAFFGGSTMWGAGTPGDNGTIPSHFSRLINQQDQMNNYKVLNFGVGGYQNFQELIILLEHLENIRLDYVIFYDWVNESIMGFRELLDGNNYRLIMQPSVEVTIQAVQNYFYEKGGIFVSWLKQLRNFSKKISLLKLFRLMKRNLAYQQSVVNSSESGYGKEGALGEIERDQIHRIVSLYKKNMKIIETLGERFGYSSFFVLQPSLFTKEGLSEYEKGPYWKDEKSVNFQLATYEAARKEFGRKNNFFDLSRITMPKQTVYLDDHHMTSMGNAMVAQELLNKLGPSIIRKIID